jgi:mono/diheme cytochrome c family protein
VRSAVAVLLAAGVLAAGCGQDDKPSPSARSGGEGAGDPAKGRQVWLAQCIACHNADPGKDGAIGPAVKGSSRELVEARVLRAAYPPGYTPKRETKVMPARPDLVAAVPDLAAYLR